MEIRSITLAVELLALLFVWLDLQEEYVDCLFCIAFSTFHSYSHHQLSTDLRNLLYIFLQHCCLLLIPPDIRNQECDSLTATIIRSKLLSQCIPKILQSMGCIWK